MIEPEVLLDGNHTRRALRGGAQGHAAGDLRSALARYNGRVEYLILKTSMVVSGKDNPRQARVDEVAERTVRVLKRTGAGSAARGSCSSPAASRTRPPPRT